MAVKNHNFRFNGEKEAERQAWEILHSKEVKEDFRSQNEFVIAAINDYYARHLATKQDPYLESREKEDAFVKGIVEAVEKKVLDKQKQEIVSLKQDQEREKEIDLERVAAAEAKEQESIAYIQMLQSNIETQV